MCRNWRAWALLGAVVVAVALAAPGARATLLPLLLIAACPLAMLFMGVGMARATRGQQDQVGDRTRREELAG